MGKLRIIAINLGLLLAVLTAAELAFGSWFGGTTLAVPRNVERRFDTAGLYAGGGPITYRRDAHGLRGDFGRPEDVALLVVGGSTTDELYVDEAAIWTRVLADAFAAEGRRVPVANAGVTGQSTVGHLRNFEAWFPRIPGLKPRWVLVYAGINDLHLDVPGNDRFDVVEPAGAWQRLRRRAMADSALYRAFMAIKGNLTARREKLIHGGLDLAGLQWVEIDPPSPLPPLPAAKEPLRAAYAERMAELIRRIRGFGAEAIVVTQQPATYYRQDGRLLAAVGGGLAGGPGEYVETAWFNDAAMATCRAAGAVCIDLAAEIEFRPGDFYDYVHTTPSGSRRIGEYLHRRLRQLI